jgi:hypothetical protein
MSSSFRRTFAVKRFASGTWDGGIYTPTTEYVESSILASCQPLKATEVQNLSEGRRAREPYWLYTDTLLNLASSPAPDRVVIGGEDYEIESRSSWQNNVIPYYMYLVLKVMEV